ncbi:transporter substrate-binding domain-containing protein [Legionella quinlivanii]|uniref:transporter substrate-binding domain-containing protein n=1 Tax=Legionella quinlivanii TaxID=45073 RepID=UPI00224380F3|nr:transporter substrate-binding domain-containing protein [Legionella quinlivanii]MCW8452133.1 transporter substrate-binding domain-containing protein [Legionella quinlivanii]
MDIYRALKPGMTLCFILLIFCNSGFCSSLIVGVTVPGLPIVQKVDSARGSYYFGFCIDIMNTICKQIGRRCEYKTVTLHNQFELLDSRKIDLLIMPNPYTPFELAQYAASIPYAVSKMQFVALQNSGIDKLADIKNKKIGAMKDTFYTLLVESPYGNINQIIAYDSMNDLISDLANHKIDVIGLNDVVAYMFISNSIYNIRNVGKSIQLGEGYGIIGLPDKAPLIKKINRAIFNIENDGTYTSIYNKYYMGEDDL